MMHLALMACLHCRIWTLIRTQDPMATLHYAEVFTLHRVRLRFQLPTTGMGLESGFIPEFVSCNINEPLVFSTSFYFVLRNFVLKMTWHGMTWYLWYDLTWYCWLFVKWYDVIWHDTVWYIAQHNVVKHARCSCWEIVNYHVWSNR